jgi:hypothetical protein
MSQITHNDEITEAFWVFHRSHPEVFGLFCRFTYELIRRGYTNGSAKLVFERIRWETMVQTDGKVKINNNFTSRYARLFEKRNPQHKGFFRKRRLNPVSANSVHVPEDEGVLV